MIDQNIDNLYVLRAIPYRDHATILSILCPNDETIRVIHTARKSGKKGSIQPFQSFSAKIKGKNDLKNLSQISNIRHCHLVGYKLVAGLYMNELIEKLSRESSKISNIHQLYTQTLQLMSTQSLPTLMRWFELNLLEALGYGIDWNMPEDLYMRVVDGQWEASSISCHNSISIQDLKRIYRLDMDAKSAKQYKRIFHQLFVTIIPGHTIASSSVFK